ncbi:hypothetical protein V502_05193 [Pseudogymnoascus sp. VKM F-4520 (FW-2644)]|nr:hypothetical protein V502_05193 [Pseudogymnoascus sp. VKM F-4520 (FW-2644)]
MSSHCYFFFYSFTIALFITHVSARAASDDTPIDQQVSCVYPLSGQYGLLPRLLFYLSLVLTVTIRRSNWLVVGAFASAMTFSATAFVHIIIIFATHWGRPPILDLDVLGIYLMSKVSVSMYPSMIVFQSGGENGMGEILVGWWYVIMFITSWVAANILSGASGPPQGSNAEAACFLPDNTLLTNLAQLNGELNPECIYNCFLKGGSILKAQSAATVVWGTPSQDTVGTVGGHISNALCATMLVLGAALPTLHSKKMLPNRLQQVIAKHPAGSESEQGLAIGQWAPWATGAFGTIGAFLYQHGDPAYGKENKEVPQAVINEAAADSPAGEQTSFVRAEGGDNIPTENLLRPARREENLASEASNTSNNISSQRYVPKAYTTPDGHGPLRRVRSAPMGGDTASLLEEVDISTYRTTRVED